MTDIYEAHTFTAKEEADLLAEWFATVNWDEESQGIPELDPEVDDEEPQSRSADPSTLDFDDLMAELRKRDPENPF